MAAVTGTHRAAAARLINSAILDTGTDQGVLEGVLASSIGDSLPNNTHKRKAAETINGSNIVAVKCRVKERTSQEWCWARCMMQASG